MNKNLLKKLLNFDFKKEEERIENFIKDEMKRLGKDGVLIGLSGGLDSSTVVYLAKNALGKEKILALILPERDSNLKNIENAKLIAKKLDLNFKEIDLSPFFGKMGIYELSIEKMPQNRKLLEGFIKKLKIPSLFAFGFPTFFSEGKKFKGFTGKIFSKYKNETLALVNAKTRLRMVFLYYYAALENYLVCGTSDKTEWNIGFYDGDAIVDIQPLIHLYKTQIKQLASFLGVPKEIIQKPSSGDLFGKGLPNEILIGLSYEILDSILYGLEHRYSREEIIKATGVKKEQIEIVLKLIETEKIRKSLSSKLS